MKYKGAISDADILINLAKADGIFMLEHLFERIYIPQYVYEREIKRRAGRYNSKIAQAIKKENSIFTLADRKNNRTINYLAKDIIEEKKILIGPGESECAGYALALGIPIIISDNYTEFKWLEEFITLTHRNILSLCVYFGHLSREEAKDTFDNINGQLDRPTSNNFDDYYRKSIKTFNEKGWDIFLGL